MAKTLVDDIMIAKLNSDKAIKEAALASVKKQGFMSGFSLEAMLNAEIIEINRQLVILNNL